MKYNVKPFICTSGNPNSLDVLISKNICKAFGLEFVNFYEKEECFKGNNLDEVINQKFILDDGFNYFGTFFSILNKDLENSKTARTNINGMGGEIYRSRWNLPDKNIDLKKFIEFVFNNISSGVVSNKFDEKTFFKNFAQKIIDNLNLKFYELSPRVTKLIYPEYKINYWGGRTISKINQFSFALCPYVEPELYLQSINIPLKYKVAGKFEAAIIKNINPELAKHNSQYGFSFYDGPNLKTKIREWSKIYTPIPLRLIVRRKNNKNQCINDLDYIKQKQKLIFNNKKELVIDNFLNLNKVMDKEMYSRALTVEYFLQHYM